MGSPLLPTHDVWLLDVIKSWPVQYQGAHTHRHHDKRRSRRQPGHNDFGQYAYHLRYRMVIWQANSPRALDSVARVLLGWRSSSIPCLALKHDLAGCPCPMCTIEHHAFELREEGLEAYVEGAVLVHRVCLQFHILLVPRVYLDWPQSLQLGVLDRPQ